MIVCDASAVVVLLLQEGEEAAWVSGVFARARLVHAPHLIDAEVASTLRRRTLHRELRASRGEEALAALGDLPMVRYPVFPTLARIWALRHRLTAYDAAYVALAESLDLPLVTTDARLARTRGHRAEIVAYGA